MVSHTLQSNRPANHCRTEQQWCCILTIYTINQNETMHQILECINYLKMNPMKHPSPLQPLTHTHTPQGSQKNKGHQKLYVQYAFDVIIGRPKKWVQQSINLLLVQESLLLPSASSPIIIDVVTTKTILIPGMCQPSVNNSKLDFNIAAVSLVLSTFCGTQSLKGTKHYFFSWKEPFMV